MGLLRKLAFPFSLLYAVVVWLRNWMFDHGLFRSQSFDTPLICVGNLSVGGTGKTPMIEFLVRELSGHKVAVLSRGYRRKSKGWVLADSHASATLLGDEPYQIYRKFQGIHVAVDANRREGIRNLETLVRPEVILLDDAYQHRKVKPGLSLLLTAYGKLYTDDWYLPTGNLRDHRVAADRAHMIIVTKCPLDLDEEKQRSIVRNLRPKPGQRVLFASLAYGSSVQGKTGSLPLDTFTDKRVTLVTGIADPTPLVAFLEEKGIVAEHLAYPDHHFFSDAEVALLSQKGLILTTEKDYMRLEPHLEQLYYIPVAHRFLADGKEVLSRRLRDFMSPDL